MSPTLTTKAKWIARGGWGVLDQGLFALTNVILNVLLARWLSSAEYGAFACAYSIFLLIGACHAALLIEPVLVFGSGRYAATWNGYLGVLRTANHLFAAVASLGLGAAGVCSWLFGSRALAWALLGMAAASPFILFMWLTKRAAYVNDGIRRAATQSSIYLALTSIGLLVLKASHFVSVFYAMLVVAIASAAASIWLINRLRRAPDRQALPRRAVVAQAHWEYGRWALMTNLLAWVPANLYVVALSTISLQVSADLRAVTTLALPLMQANAALSATFLPIFVVRFANHSDFQRLMWRALSFFVALGGIYGIAIGVVGTPLMQLLYGGKYYVSPSAMWLLALIPLCDGILTALRTILRSSEQPKQVFWAQAVAAVCAVLTGVPATMLWGVTGAIGAISFSSLLAVFVLGLSTWKLLTATAQDKRNFELNTQPSETQSHCDLCKAPGTLYGRANGYDLLSCPTCNLLWTNPLTVPEQSVAGDKNYPGEELYVSNVAAQRQRFDSQLETFLKVSGDTNRTALRILEVGSGLGFFLDTCEKFGIAAEGCDIAERAVRVANQKGRRARRGTLDESYTPESFDAIFAFNLIGHLPHPHEFLSHAHRVLKPGGTLVLETPIQEGLFHRVARLGHLLSLGRLNFYGMRPSGHIYKFSKKTFAMENGFRRIYERNIESPFGEIWGNSSTFTFDNRFLYRCALPITWLVAKLTKQGNRLFVVLRKSVEPQRDFDNSQPIGATPCRGA